MKRFLGFALSSLAVWVVLAVIVKPPMLDFIVLPQIFKHIEDTLPFADTVIAVEDVGVDVGLLQSWEGNTANAVVPSEHSGPTVSMGLDLGTAGPNLIKMIASDCVDSSTLSIMLSANGLRGFYAEAWSRRNRLNLSWSQRSCISTSICKTMLKLIDSTHRMSNAPVEMKTAAVSFSMATGRPDLIRSFVLNKQWYQMSSFIHHYHDAWSGPEGSYFRKRRKLEADLVSLRINNIKVEIDPD